MISVGFHNFIVSMTASSNIKVWLGLLYIVAVLFPCGVFAQFSPGKKGGGNVVVEYRKVKDDTLRVRKSKQGLEKAGGVVARPASGSKKQSVGKPKSSLKKSASVAVKKGVDKVSKPNVKKVDSLYFEPIVYRLGERVIMQGDSGADVRSVARILIKKLYFSEDSIIYTKDGVLYDGDLVRAVKHFQEFNGFYPDGIITRELIKALRKRK